MLSSETIRELREDHAETDKNLQVTVCNFDTIVFSAVFHLINLLYASVMLSIYAKLSSYLLAVLRESGSKHVGNCLRIGPSHHQELVSHPMPDHIDALIS